MTGRVIALIPAGGESRRMGTNKLALPWRDGKILTHLVGQLTPLVNRTIVLLGPRSAPLRSEISPLAEVYTTLGQTPDMRSTIEFGLKSLEKEDPTGTGVFIALADQPHIGTHLIKRMITTFRNQPSSLVIPTVDGRNAHPIIIPLVVLRTLPMLDSKLGLNTLVRSHASKTIFLPVDDPTILIDIDEPADYDRLWQQGET
jgi:molybdenum cofactor cytidylyltransferase